MKYIKINSYIEVPDETEFGEVVDKFYNFIESNKWKTISDFDEQYKFTYRDHWELFHDKYDYEEIDEYLADADYSFWFEEDKKLREFLKELGDDEED